MEYPILDYFGNVIGYMVGRGRKQKNPNHTNHHQNKIIISYFVCWETTMDADNGWYYADHMRRWLNY